MVMHASPSDTLAKFSPIRQTVEGFVVDLVRDVSVPVFVQKSVLTPGKLGRARSWLSRKL